VGANFGMGSSREHVPLAMKASGVRCVIGSSFARIFYRNCVNLALPAISCPEAAKAAKAGSEISIDAVAGKVTVDGREFVAAPVPPFMLEMLERGGLIPWAQHKLAQS
jgi:3-isopropylmalate/(R)-2-methylmalate dehydratase small subunit